MANRKKWKQGKKGKGVGGTLEENLSGRVNDKKDLPVTKKLVNAFFPQPRNIFPLYWLLVLCGL